MHFHICLTYFVLILLKQVVSVVLENYGGHKEKSENPEGTGSRWVQEVQKTERVVSPSEAMLRVPSWSAIVSDKGELNLTL